MHSCAFQQFIATADKKVEIEPIANRPKTTIRNSMSGDEVGFIYICIHILSLNKSCAFALSTQIILTCNRQGHNDRRFQWTDYSVKFIVTISM